MIFKSKNKKHPPKLIISQVMSVEDSIYKYALDTRLLPPEQIRDWLKLSPIPEDVLDEDSAESLARLKALAPLHHLIDEFSKTTATLILMAMTDGDIGSPSDEEIRDMMTIIRSATYTASLATVTQLEDLGVIEYKFAR